jgi:hypothetical protein
MVKLYLDYESDKDDQTAGGAWARSQRIIMSNYILYMMMTFSHS